MYYVSFLRVILFKGDADHRDLHSFPTRRSSDLSSRLRAASIAIWIFSLTRFCPMYSSSRRGRTLTSMRASSSYAAPETIRCGCPCIIRFVLASAIAFLDREGTENTERNKVSYYLRANRGAACRAPTIPSLDS